MSAAVTVPSLMMMSSIVSEESLERDTQTHTDTHTLTRARARGRGHGLGSMLIFFKVNFENKKCTRRR